jgi:hypothetical protein
VFDISNIYMLTSVYFANFHSVAKYEVIFGGNSFNGKMMFTLEK